MTPADKTRFNRAKQFTLVYGSSVPQHDEAA
jgi:hypothetical protein